MKYLPSFPFFFSTGSLEMEEGKTQREHDGLCGGVEWKNPFRIFFSARYAQKQFVSTTHTSTHSQLPRYGSSINSAMMMIPSSSRLFWSFCHHTTKTKIGHSNASFAKFMYNLVDSRRSPVILNVCLSSVVPNGFGLRDPALGFVTTCDSVQLVDRSVSAFIPRSISLACYSDGDNQAPHCQNKRRRISLEYKETTLLLCSLKYRSRNPFKSESSEQRTTIRVRSASFV